MTDQAPNLQQQNLQAATENAQNFYGQSIGSLKSQVQNYREQLEQFSQQLPEDSQAQIQEMIDSYIELESSMDQAAQDAGVQDQMESDAQQTQQQIQQAAGGAAQQAQEVAGQATDQAQQVAGQAAEQAGGGQQQQPNATQAAQQKAQQMGVDLSQVQGSGADGRITVRDVQSAANQQ